MAVAVICRDLPPNKLTWKFTPFPFENTDLSLTDSQKSPGLFTSGSPDGSPDSDHGGGYMGIPLQIFSTQKYHITHGAFPLVIGLPQVGHPPCLFMGCSMIFPVPKTIQRFAFWGYPKMTSWKPP